MATETARHNEVAALRHIDTQDLIKADESSLDFWDNEDDRVWDNV